jgi:hypothetical protein
LARLIPLRLLAPSARSQPKTEYSYYLNLRSLLIMLRLCGNNSPSVGNGPGYGKQPHLKRRD